MDRTSVGLVVEQEFSFGSPDEPLLLESGETLGPVRLVYETYGEPNEDRSNAILLLHALSGDAHAAGYHHPKDRRTGWWDDMVGPGKALDTNRFWIICSNIIGGCKGSTGPGSENSRTGEPYGPDFPTITIGDMVEAQCRLVDHLGIGRLHAVIGGSMGGFQALEWSLRFPERVGLVICVASGPRLSAQGIAFNAVGRNAITSDPDWNAGRYYGTPGPARGLAIARMIGHITYLSELSLDSKFGRKLQSADRFGYDFSEAEFAVESYLVHQGRRFTERFDANSYLYITKAMDYFDLSRCYGPLNRAFAATDSRFLIISYSSDWLFTTEHSKEVVRALAANGKDVSFLEVNSPYGHDAFLLEAERLTRVVTAFLDHRETKEAS